MLPGVRVLQSNKMAATTKDAKPLEIHCHFLLWVIPWEGKESCQGPLIYSYSMFDALSAGAATAAVLKTIAGERSTGKCPWESSSPSFLAFLSTGRFAFSFCVTSHHSCLAQTKLKEQVQTGILHLPCSDLVTKPLRWFSAFRGLKERLCSIVSVLHCLFKIRNAWTASRCLPLRKGFRCMHRDSGAILPWAAGQTCLGEKWSFSQVLWLLSAILSLLQWQQHICRGEPQGARDLQEDESNCRYS